MCAYVYLHLHLFVIPLIYWNDHFKFIKNYFCMLNIVRRIAHQSSITFFLNTSYIDNTFRACGKDSPDKKPQASLIYITIRVNQI